jgi:alpha-L-fucosidase
MGDNNDTIKKNTETLIDSSMEVCLEVRVEKTKYMLLSPNQNAGQNCGKNTVNRLFEIVAKFKSMVTTVTNQNLIQEEIKRRLNSGNTTIQSRTFCLLISCPKT